MKKLLLVGAILMGVATASEAGISFHLGLPGLPLPLPPLPVPRLAVPPVVVAPPAPVFAQPYCPPVYGYAPGVVVNPYVYGYGYYPYRSYYYGPRFYGGHRSWGHYGHRH